MDEGGHDHEVLPPVQVRNGPGKEKGTFRRYTEIVGVAT